MLSISLVAEEVFNIAGTPVTNSLLTTWVGIVIVSLLVIIGLWKHSIVPKGLQLILESVYSFFLNLCETVLGEKRLAEKALPFIGTIFIFVFAANIFEVIPGVGTIGIKKVEEHTTEAPIQATQAMESDMYQYQNEYAENVFPPEPLETSETIEAKEVHMVPLFRPGTTDLNTTLALALISVIVTQIVGFSALGFGYLKKFFNFSSPINFFVGILELISEFAKIISFSFRLFGNIFAGEVLLTVILMLVPYFVPIPFYGLEVFVAVVQAFVFAMLTLVFMKLAMTSHDEESHAAAH